MLQAMLAGVASLKAHQARLNIIGNNIANVNTTAFKSQSMGFQDLLSQTLRSASRPNGSIGGINPVQMGLGVNAVSVDTNTVQGSLQATNRPTDFALSGNGYFLVGNASSVYYTRDGSFDTDADGVLVHSSTGEKLLGWSADPTGNIVADGQLSALTSLKIPIGVLNSVQQSSKLPFAGNLSSQAAPSDVITVRSIVYDSLGGEHNIVFSFTNRQTKDAASGNFTVSPGPPPVTDPGPAGSTGRWDWTAKEGSTTIGSSANAGSAAIYFDANGKFVAPTSGSNSVSITPANGSSPFSVSLDYSVIQQVQSSTNIQAEQANGYKPGTLASFNVGADGTIQGTFTNGFTRPIGRIALATFANDSGLEKAGSNRLIQSSNSGLPEIGPPSENGKALVSVGYLEQSNVDISEQYTTMIITQRGFQANTKVVSTVDELMQDVLAMKR